jgi:hypothetical protein
VSKRRPCIIEGIVPDADLSSWDFAHLRSKAADAVVEVEHREVSLSVTGCVGFR